MRSLTVRGGRWYYTAHYCRSANRYTDHPDFSHYSLGFRIALTKRVM